MNKEFIKDYLNELAISSGDKTISKSMVDKIVDHVDELEQQCKRQKIVIDKLLINKEVILYLVDKVATEYLSKETEMVSQIIRKIFDILEEVRFNGKI